VHVRRLREKVEVDPSTPLRLVTVFGRGYRWDRTDPADPTGPAAG
jgi:DNA-binding response OmpR family regulator